ncbi:MAG TPA: hypothetical protein ENN67_07920, partial [Firmicutes bacterium]|nr:hypothetical protein [Bacillota bacterium]
MNRAFLYGIINLLFLVLISCSGGNHSIAPSTLPNEMTSAVQPTASNTHLWGYWDVYIDIESGTVEAVENRKLFFTGNVTNFLNAKDTNMSFKINEIITGPDYVDIDINVGLLHPFPGMPQYHGYDVRGIFMGDGSGYIETGGVNVSVLGIDQYMFDDPDTSPGDMPGGGPDGYTRWFNRTEFSAGGMLLFQYTPGKLASIDFAGTATLCPYSYFADTLGSNENLWGWLENNQNLYGRFSSGAKNERNYYLRFPNGKGIKYGYAVIANWMGMLPEHHPSNAPEAIACKIEDNSDLYYGGPGNFGGNISLDISLWGWSGKPEIIYIETDALSSPYMATDDQMIPISGGENFSTWRIEIAPEQITSLDDIDCWIIVEYETTYANEFGVGNLVEDEALKAYFKHVLTVGDELPPDADITVITPNGGEVLAPGSDFEITWTSYNVTGNVSLEYSTDNFVSEIVVISDDEENDGSYLWYVPCDPSDTVRVKVTSILAPSVYDTSDDDFSIENSGWVQNWGYTPTYSYCGASGVAVDKFNNVYIAGKYNGLTDFNPGPEVENYNTNGMYDIYVSQYTVCGEYLWTRVFGGPGTENCRSASVDFDGNVYLSGYFSDTVDFNPDPDESDIRNAANGDAFLVKFDADGDYEWARTWGGSAFDFAYDVVCDDFGYVYTSGHFFGTVNFDSTGGSDIKTSNGSYDCFVSKYDTEGNYYWTRTWGGSASTYD